MTAIHDSSCQPDDADNYETYLLKLRLANVYHCQDCGRTFPGHSYAFVKEHVELTHHKMIRGDDVDG